MDPYIPLGLAGYSSLANTFVTPSLYLTALPPSCVLVEFIPGKCVCFFLKNGKAMVADHIRPRTAWAGNNKKTPKARTQSRQQQRVRQRRKFNANEASRIQKLFKTYPRKAVRRVLGETSPLYSGNAEAAAEYLRATYHRSQPPPEHLERSRKLYDDCS